MEQSPKTLTELCGTTPAAFEENLKQCPPDVDPALWRERLNELVVAKATGGLPHLRPGAPQRRVVCAANRHMDSGLVVCGARHYDSLMRAVMAQLGGWPLWNRCDQGFVDQYGTFMTREEALQVALAAGQRLYRCGGDETRLFSENMY